MKGLHPKESDKIRFLIALLDSIRNGLVLHHIGSKLGQIEKMIDTELRSEKTRIKKSLECLVPTAVPSDMGVIAISISPSTHRGV